MEILFRNLIPRNQIEKKKKKKNYIHCPICKIVLFCLGELKWYDIDIDFRLKVKNNSWKGLMVWAGAMFSW